MLLCACGSAPPIKPSASVVKVVETPRCSIASHLLSVPGHGGLRPNVAFGKEGFGVVWEEATDSHRSIRFVAFDDKATPISTSVEVADLPRGGSEPHVVVAPNGNGYAVIWSTEDLNGEDVGAIIAFRRIDVQGRPLGDVVRSIAAPSARALAVLSIPKSGESGYALGWWSWATTPRRQVVSYLDESGAAKGEPVELTHDPVIDPVMDFRLGPDGQVLGSWEERIAGDEHVMAGEISRAEVVRRLDVGRGSVPSLGGSRVYFTSLGSGQLWSSPIVEARPTQFGEGQFPDASSRSAGGAVFCYVAESSAGDRTVDQLRCQGVSESGAPEAETLIASSPGGVLSFEVIAAGATYGVVYQLEEDAGSAVSFAAVHCS